MHKRSDNLEPLYWGRWEKQNKKHEKNGASISLIESMDSVYKHSTSM